MLSIPIKLDVSAEKAEQALRRFYAGVENALDGIVDLNGTVINFDVNFRKTGDDVVKALSDTDAAQKKAEKSARKLDQGQENSIKRIKHRVTELKKERDALAINSKIFKLKSAEIKKHEARLLSLQGVQRGSIAALKAKRAELIQVRNNLKLNSTEYNRLTAEIEKFDATLKGNNSELDKSKKKTLGFVNVFAKIAIVSAGIQSIGAALRSVGNAIDVYTRRTKDVEGFNLAIRNVGFSQAETTRIFNQAEKTAKALGAPLQQVERSYKRMIPPLKAIGASAQDSDKFIEAISARTQTLGLNTEQSGRLFEAFAQVLSKGKLQAEELNQQISELDGAFRTQLADALGVTTAQLTEMISKGEVTAEKFVKAVNLMQNGVEALKQRIREGNATITQLQNNIKTLETKNIEAIGKAIEPAIKAFLGIRNAVAEFINEFVKTPLFFNLKTVFNGIALGAQNFVRTLLDAITAVNAFISPIVQLVNFVLDLDSASGGLVGALTSLALAYGTVTGAIFLHNRAMAAKIALQKSDMAMNQVAALKKSGKAALALGPALLLAAGALKVLTVAMKAGKARGEEFDKNLKSVGEKLKLIGQEAPGAANSFEKAFNELGQGLGIALSVEIDQLANQLRSVQMQSAATGMAFKSLGADTKDLASINRLSLKDFERLYDLEQTREMGIKNEIETTKNRIKLAEEQGNADVNLIRHLKDLLAELEKEAPLVSKNVKALERSNHFKNVEKKASADLKKELEKLNKESKEFTDSLDLAAIKARTQAIKEFGKEVNAASLVDASDVGIEKAVSEERLQRFLSDLDRIKKLGDENRTLSEDEKKRISELTTLIAEERQKQAELGVQAQELINTALEEGISKAQELGEVSGNAASNLVGAFDGLAGSLSQGLSAATSLMDQLVADEIKGLEVGSRMRQEIVLRQLRAQAKANALEDMIARKKLTLQNTIAVSEAKIAGLRLQAEAKIARARGQHDLAGALEEAAGFQGLVVAGLEEQFRVGMAVLDLEKRKKDQALIRKGVDEKITNNQSKMGRILGVQKTSVNDTFRIVNKMVGESSGLLDAFADSAEQAQNLKEDTNRIAIAEGVKEADKIAGAFDRGADAARRMKDELSDVAVFAKQISNIVGGGTSNPARAMGGPVRGGSSYFVNDGGGREGFLSNSGNFSMLPAARNINWTAPTSGTVIPANLVERYQQALAANQSVTSRTSVQPVSKGVDRVSASIDSGSLVQRMAAVMSGNGGDQRITNHVTIQSQEPVTDASKIMTNVARMKLRKGGRF